MIMKILIIFFNLLLLHPNHISYTEIFYNSSSNRYEISIKVIPDNFENGLKKANCKNVDLIGGSIDTTLNKCVENYLQNHFTIQIQKKKIKLNFLGFEFKEKELYLYLESEKLSEPKQLEIKNDILFEETKIQMNIIRYKSEKRDLSVRLKNPESNWRIK